MIKILGIADVSEWTRIVCSFAEYDVYYLPGYMKAFQIHGDGDPYLFFYEANGLRAIYVYMRRSTEIYGVFDTITPYGYGGFLLEGNTSVENLQILWNAYTTKMQELHVVDNFVRYHPIIANAIFMRKVSVVIDLGKTIAIDLASPELIWENIASKNRNMIRKAEKNGVEIHHAHDEKLFKDFIRIYNSTMDKDHAEDYYYFEESFYRSIHEDLSGHYEMFYATYEGEIIAMSIILFANKQMHYHLSGSLMEYRSLAPSNLLLYKAALWGCEQGFRTFHLGGGVGSGEDNLYKFKAAFNRRSDYQFSIAKHIFDNVMYDRLVDIRAEKDIDFNRNSIFFPLYRS